ncbi:MAG: hypothetical protein R3Y61_03585, partial [Rikenellaceae bacterium]
MTTIIRRHRNYCEIDYKPQTAFFSGYRTKKLLKYNSAPFTELREKLRATLLELYNFGYKRF